ncbi:MAG TPA: GAF domain-containing protein [Vicinamibacteria bacterium]
MNIDRLLRDVEARLSATAGVGEAVRLETMDALREAIARERRGLDPSFTVEVERERRQAAEQMRGALEAIHGPVRPDEALEEVLKQLGRVVEADLFLVAAAEPGVGLRVTAARGDEAPRLSGALLSDPRLQAAAEDRRPVRAQDAEEEGPLASAGAPALCAWMALPLLLEGDVVGMLVAGRTAVDGFTDEEVLSAKAFAYWAAPAVRRLKLHEQLRRYATLLEQVVELDQRVFHGEGPEILAPAIVDGACRIGGYRGGMLVLQTPRGPVVAGATGEAFAGALGRPAPADLASTAARRLSPARMLDVAESLGVELPAEQVLLVPLATPDSWLGCLVLLDPNGESAEDRLLESYASRAAVAFRHVAHARP